MMHRLLVPLCLLSGCVGLTPTGDEGTPVSPRPGRPPSGGPDDSGTTDSGEADTAAPDPGGDTGIPGGGGEDSGTGGDSGADSENPLAGLTLWVDPGSPAANEAAGATGTDAALFGKIASQPVAKWLGGWNTDIEGDVRTAVDEAAADGAVRAFVVYNLPNRDCGGYSAGGAADLPAYEAWIDLIASGMAGRASIVILEPDGLSMTDCLSSSEADDRYAMLKYAVATLQGAGAHVYLDAGHSAWHPASTMADRLLLADVGAADGFALNTSNFETTDDILAYGEEVSGMVGGAHFIADTARNGLGPTSDHQWCNPDGRALGMPPSLATGNPLVDGLLWVKTPGESDGSCNGGPSAGTWWPDYARGLAERAAW